MAMPSKFSQKRRELILVALAAGASRRTAAELAGISHRTLGRWIERGESAFPGGRRHQFYLDVLEAESNPHHPRLLPLVETPAHDVSAAWKFIERTESAPEPSFSGPMKVIVSFSDGTPIS